MRKLEDEMLDLLANGIMDVVAEYISNVIGYENETKPGITLSEAILTGLGNSGVDDSYERYGVEVVLRLLEQTAYEDNEELDIYRKENTEAIIDLCINYYKKVFLNASMTYPNITVDDFMDRIDDYELDDLAEKETEMTIRHIKKILRDHESFVNYLD